MGYPRFEKEPILYNIFAKLFNEICPGASVTNNRWGMKTTPKITRFEGDFKTPEYTHLSEVTAEPWEMNRGLGYSFGYNQNEGERETITVGNLARLFVDVVSKNGNMLLDLAPLPDGSFSKIQTERLDHFTEFMQIYSPAIQFTRPFLKVGQEPAGNFRFLKSKEGDKVFIFILNPEGENLNSPEEVKRSGELKFILPITTQDHNLKFDTSVLLHDNLFYPLEVVDKLEGLEIDVKINSKKLRSDWPICVVLHDFSQEANLAFAALKGATEGKIIEQKRDD